MGAAGDSATLLQQAMQLSFDKVEEVSGIDMPSDDATEFTVAEYIAEVMAEFAAADDEGKLEIIAREFYIASFGNSVEAYNLYRRTGYPNLEPHVLSSGGDFPRSFFLPSSEIETNASLTEDDQKTLTDQVFWDTNPAGFIDQKEKIMKKIKYILCVLVIGATYFACTDQSTFRNPSIHELERGAYIRFVAAPPTSFVPEVAQSVSISAELYDPNGNVSQYDLSLTANIVSTGNTYNVDNFMTITSFPATLNITSQMIADAIGVDLSTFGAGDFIQFTAVATRNDGVKFYGIAPTFDDDNGTVGLGNTEPNLLTADAYMDAMDFDYIIACPIPEEYFVGKYNIEVLSSDAPFGPIFGSITEVEFTEKNVYQRTFEATYLLDKKQREKSKKKTQKKEEGIIIGRKK
eukprot:TRINITY_DN81672_c0_g2_i2.p1 TRINITY_DN81672_c0_g2~~TRINITY_DN81672_c0_g2_i2.p1  ORF type:complete len:405 (+),score=47.58 TRINITY_DN81672_c0_g2_i2:232-1446(+)